MEKIFIEFGTRHVMMLVTDRNVTNMQIKCHQHLKITNVTNIIVTDFTCLCLINHYLANIVIL